MTRKILLIVGIILILYAYIYAIILYLTNKNKKTNKTAQEISLKILDNEYSINLIKTNDSMFSKYNIKRNMVKLSSNTYDSSNYFSQSIASLLSGYAISNSKYLNIIGKIFKELKFISFSPIVVIILSIITTNIGDSKISIIILILIAIYQYILNIINTETINKLDIRKEEINVLLNKFNNINTIFFISTLIEIIRLVIIILNI